MSCTAKPLPAAPLPCCPIAGKPAKRRIQKVPKKLLRSLWRFGLGIDIARLLEAAPAIGLYESECGLVFFHPLIEGDAKFYADFYARVSMHERLTSHLLARAEYRRAARHIRPGATVLDIGCGVGAFRVHLPHARYLGLDPFAPPEADTQVLRESTDQHCRDHPAAYDVVTAFQVIEHLAEPRLLVERMLRALKPGGLLILCAPLHPSAMTAIPNFLLNALPHHLSWWNRQSFATLAEVFTLDIIELAELEPSPHEGLIHWMDRLCRLKAGQSLHPRYFAHRWTWHLSAAVGYGLAHLAYRVRPLPGASRSVAIFLTARKPV